MRALVAGCLVAVSCASPVKAQWDVPDRDGGPLPFPTGRAIFDNDQTWVISLANIESHVTLILEPGAGFRVVSRISGSRRTTEIHRLLRQIDTSNPGHQCLMWSVERPGSGKVQGTIFEYCVMGIKLAECFIPNDHSKRDAHASVNIPLRDGIWLIVGYGRGLTIDVSIKL
jgi:hypothetical protein